MPSAPSRRYGDWNRYGKPLMIALIIFLVTLLFQETILRWISPHVMGPDKLHGDILNSTLGFEKIYVLNLPSRTDRRDALALAASLSNIKLDWIAGVDGANVSEKALPPGERTGLSNGGKGSWRAHMNAIRTIVEENLSSALILEDDIDWDIRLKSQLQTFSLASRALYSQHARNHNSAEKHSANSRKTREKVSIPLTSMPAPTYPKNNPYGDGWDLAWLGHCGTFFRDLSPSSRILIQKDPTVPVPKYLKPHPFAAADSYGTLYPPHTRIVHHPAGPSCSFAYALTQSGARKLLYEFGVKAFDKQMDFMLGDFCDNVETINGTRSGVGRAESEGRCVTVQPPFFSHHYPEAASSDIDAPGGGMVTMIGTLYVRCSVRMNLARLITGRKDFLDQWPDEEG